MSRYERVNLLAQYRATPFGGPAQVLEWEVRYFEPGGQAANSAFYASRADAERDIVREARRGFSSKGPFPARRAATVPPRPPSAEDDGAPASSQTNAPDYEEH